MTAWIRRSCFQVKLPNSGVVYSQSARVKPWSFFFLGIRVDGYQLPHWCTWRSSVRVKPRFRQFSSAKSKTAQGPRQEIVEPTERSRAHAGTCVFMRRKRIQNHDRPFLSRGKKLLSVYMEMTTDVSVAAKVVSLLVPPPHWSVLLCTGEV